MLGRFVRRTAITGAVAYGVYAAGIRPWKHRWDATAAERTMPLAGDDLVSSPTAVETRAITIDAPPRAVWPWLLQMGDGRGGWYSYDRPDVAGRSAMSILPQFQDLAPGDILPTYPGGGFTVKAVDHERALVLYTDSSLVREQEAASRGGAGNMPAGVEFSGRPLGVTLPEFAASWVFVLEPRAGQRTRLLERLRVALPPGAARLLKPVTGFGIFLMQRKQLLGIKSRAEQAWQVHISEPVESHVA